jgi:hypothetical protein
MPGRPHPPQEIAVTVVNPPRSPQRGYLHPHHDHEADWKEGNDSVAPHMLRNITGSNAERLAHYPHVTYALPQPSPHVRQPYCPSDVATGLESFQWYAPRQKEKWKRRRVLNKGKG